MAQVLNTLQTFFYSKVGFFFCLLAILFISLFIKIQNAQDAVAFADYDEYYTVQVAYGTFEDALPNDSVANIWKNASVDNGNNVLYNFILILWVNLMGKTEWMIRVLSLIFHLGSIFLSIKILSKFGTPKTYVLLAVVALSFHPTLHQFSIITRAYSLLMFEAILLFYLCYAIEKKSIKTHLLTTFTILALVLTHYLAVPFVFAIFIDKILTAKKRSLVSIDSIPFWVAAFLVCVYFSMNLDWFISIAGKNDAIQQTAEMEDSTRHLSVFSFFDRFFGFVSAWFCSVGYLGKLANGVFSEMGRFLLNLAAVLFLALILIKTKTKKNFMILFGIGLVFPVTTVLMSQHLTGFSLKYSIAFIALYLILFFKESNKNSLYLRLLSAFMLINILINITAQQAIHIRPTFEVFISGEKKSFTQSQTPLLRDFIAQQNQRFGFVPYQSEQELCFLKTLMIDFTLDYKLEQAGVVSAPNLK
jgi:hypothetical protein